MMTTTTPEAVLVPATPKVGDILVCSWGYDQTNIDWYQVVAVTKASVRIVKIHGRMTESNGPSDKVEPVPGSIDSSEKTMLKRFRLSGKSYSVSISSYSSARLWDGSPRFQTGWGYGH